MANDLSGLDGYLTNGNWHTCECGKRFSDSDPGPCHVRCTICGQLFGEGEGDFQSEKCETCLEEERTREEDEALDYEEPDRV